MKTDRKLYGRWLWPHVTMNENGHSWHWTSSTRLTQNAVRTRGLSVPPSDSSSYLIHLFPLGRGSVVNVLGGKGLRADPQNGVGVRQAGHDPFHIVVFSCEILCLQQVDAYHPLGETKRDMVS